MVQYHQCFLLALNSLEFVKQHFHVYAVLAIAQFGCVATEAASDQVGFSAASGGI
jgi:hypothetical protein